MIDLAIIGFLVVFAGFLGVLILIQLHKGFLIYKDLKAKKPRILPIDESLMCKGPHEYCKVNMRDGDQALPTTVCMSCGYVVGSEHRVNSYGLLEMRRQVALRTGLKQLNDEIGTDVF